MNKTRFNNHIKRILELENTLSDCPGCKSDNVSIHSIEFGIDFYVMCNRCKCRTRLFEYSSTVKDPIAKAVNDWNGRINLITEHDENLLGKI